MQQAEETANSRPGHVAYAYERAQMYASMAQSCTNKYNKLAAKYAQLREVDSMRAVARAHQNRNLADFENALRVYQDGEF